MVLSCIKHQDNTVLGPEGADVPVKSYIHWSVSSPYYTNYYRSRPLLIIQKISNNKNK